MPNFGVRCMPAFQLVAFKEYYVAYLFFSIVAANTTINTALFVLVKLQNFYVYFLNEIKTTFNLSFFPIANGITNTSQLTMVISKFFCMILK